MKETKDRTEEDKRNEDPISGEPGSHPVATGVGATAGAFAGAAIGAAVGGPIGAVVGIAAAAVAGGLAGKAVGEKIDPTVEDAYWKEHHKDQPFAKDEPYENYRNAYRVGYEGYAAHGKSRTFDEAETDLRAQYEMFGARTPWETVIPASRAAWDRVHRRSSGGRPAGEAAPSGGRTTP